MSTDETSLYALRQFPVVTVTHESRGSSYDAVHVVHHVLRAKSQSERRCLAVMHKRDDRCWHETDQSGRSDDVRY
jgi:hypothetical protein